MFTIVSPLLTNKTKKQIDLLTVAKVKLISICGNAAQTKQDDRVLVACLHHRHFFFPLHAFKQQVWHNICFTEPFGLVFNFNSHCSD